MSEQTNERAFSTKRAKRTALILCCIPITAVFGVHRFYLKRNITGLLYALTGIIQMVLRNLPLLSEFWDIIGIVYQVIFATAWITDIVLISTNRITDIKK